MCHSACGDIYIAIYNVNYYFRIYILCMPVMVKCTARITVPKIVISKSRHLAKEVVFVNLPIKCDNR